MTKIPLSFEAKSLLKETDEERIQYIKDNRWINYKKAQDIFDILEDLKKYEKDKSRISSILLVGASTNGKTTLLEEFIKKYPPYDNYVKDHQNITEEFLNEYNAMGVPILYINAPAEPSETRLYSQILHTIDAPYNEGMPPSKKQHLVEHYLKILNVEMLIIDEIHNILSGSIARQNQVTNAIKNLSNTLKIPIVLAGIKDALRAISTDDQIMSRFRPVFLPKWVKGKEFNSLIASFITSFPLKKETTANSAFAKEVLEISQGYIGDIADLLKAAAIYAIRTKSEIITLHEIKNCGFRSMQRAETDSKLLKK